MKMRTVEITVGAFMIAAILALLMLALQVSGLGDFFREDAGYKIKAEFSNIGGLKPRAKVSIAGVVVGRVISIVLEPKSFNAEALIAIDPDKTNGPLPIDTRASIMTSGLLGDNYIALTPGFSEAEFLKNNSVISLDNTDSAIVLEQLISKFVANQVSPGTNSPDNNTPEKPENPSDSNTTPTSPPHSGETAPDNSAHSANSEQKEASQKHEMTATQLDLDSSNPPSLNSPESHDSNVTLPEKHTVHEGEPS